MKTHTLIEDIKEKCDAHDSYFIYKAEEHYTVYERSVIVL